MTEPREPTDQLGIGATDMTDNTQPEALRALAESVAWTGRWYDAGCNTVHCTYDKEDSIEHDEIAHPVPLGVSGYIAAAHPQAVIALLDRIAELEAQLESIGAGGVSGPMMGQPQAMPDISALTERGAKAWAGVDAQGLRDGVASAGSEPVAWTTGLNWRTDTRCQSEMVVKLTRKSQPEYGFTQPLYTPPSSPEGTVGVWQDIATAPKDGTRILLHPAIEVADAWSKGHWNDENKCWIVGGSPSGIAHTSWAPLPPAPPTTSAGSGKGE